MAIPVLYPFSPVDKERVSSSFVRPLLGRSVPDRRVNQLLFAPTDALPGPDWGQESSQSMITVPGLGRRSATAHRRRLALLMAISLSLMLLLGFYQTRVAAHLFAQMTALGQSLEQSKRLADVVTSAMGGDVQALMDLGSTTDALSRSIADLQRSAVGIGFAPESENIQPTLTQALSMAEQTADNANVVLEQQELLVQAREVLGQIHSKADATLELAHSVARMRQQLGAAAIEATALAELSALTQQIGLASEQLLTHERGIAERGSQLRNDVERLNQLALGVLYGNAEPGLNATLDRPTRAKLVEMILTVEAMRFQTGAVLNHLQSLTAAQQAQWNVVDGAESLGAHLEALKRTLLAQTRQSILHPALLLPLALLTLLGGLGWVVVARRVTQHQQMLAEEQLRGDAISQRTAGREAQAARPANEHGRQLCLRLADDLEPSSNYSPSPGVRVLEEVAVAVADAMSQRAEEIRLLTESLQSHVVSVTQLVVIRGASAPKPSAKSGEPLQETPQAGALVVEIASRIHDISAQARQLAQITCQSLQTAESGIFALQRMVGGVHTNVHQARVGSHPIERRIERRRSHVALTPAAN